MQIALDSLDLEVAAVQMARDRTSLKHASMVLGQAQGKVMGRDGKMSSGVAVGIVETIATGAIAMGMGRVHTKLRMTL